jgi:SAM-dependent methyltransferase
MSSIAYHLGELATALAADDARRVMPQLSANPGPILDIGCGIGQTLIACELQPETFACGLDLDIEALAVGQTKSAQIRFVCASGESLPFRDESFSYVISRVALPYMNIPRALGEIARILKPGGQVWLTLHPFQLLRPRLWQTLLSGNPRQIAYLLYVVANGLLLHLSGRQFRFPLKRSRCESFQTVRGMKLVLRRTGFTQISAVSDRFFIVTAIRKSGASGNQS